MKRLTDPCQTPHDHRRRPLPAVLAAVLAACAFNAGAATTKFEVEPASTYNKPYIVDLSGDPTDSDFTGLQLLNLSDVGGSVSLATMNQLPNLDLKQPQGFKLLDLTLQVNSTLPAAGRRLQIRFDYGRANLRRAGIRAGSLRLLRADIRAGRWLPAVRAIRDGRRADIRYITGGADFKLGHFGNDTDKQYVWAVLDSSGDQLFAIAGKPVPLPAAGVFLASGLGALILSARRRRRR